MPARCHDCAVCLCIEEEKKAQENKWKEMNETVTIEWRKLCTHFLLLRCLLCLYLHIEIVFTDENGTDSSDTCDQMPKQDAISESEKWRMQNEGRQT